MKANPRYWTDALVLGSAVDVGGRIEFHQSTRYYAQRIYNTILILRQWKRNAHRRVFE